MTISVQKGTKLGTEHRLCASSYAYVKYPGQGINFYMRETWALSATRLLIATGENISFFFLKEKIHNEIIYAFAHTVLRSFIKNQKIFFRKPL